jgi:hypothetical protein
MGVNEEAFSASHFPRYSGFECHLAMLIGGQPCAYGSGFTFNLTPGGWIWIQIQGGLKIRAGS